MKKLILGLLCPFLFLMHCTAEAQAYNPKKKTYASTARKKTTKSNLLEGSKYVLNKGIRSKLWYTRKFYKSKAGNYTTVYTVYNDQKKEIALITALHYKKNKSIEVRVKDLSIAGFPLSNIEKTSYEEPFLGRFGSVGKVGAIGKGKSKSDAPSQLGLSFLSKKFDYIKVVSIADAHEDPAKDLEVFELDRS